MLLHGKFYLMKCICVVTQKAYVVFKVYSIPVLINPEVEFGWFFWFKIECLKIKWCGEELV